MLHDDYQEKKKKIGEARDVLDAIGHEKEKEGIKWTKYFMDLWDAKEREKNQLRKNKLTRSAKFTRREYHLTLYKIVCGLLTGLELPLNFYTTAFFNEKGVGINLTDKFKRSWKRAIKPTGIPKYDLNVAMQMVGMAEETAWKVESDKELQKTKSGLYLA